MDSPLIERVLIQRHCAHKEMYDDGGYCETKIKKYEPYYWAGVADDNGELMCPECMLQCLIYQLQNGGCIPEYVDDWNNDFNTAKVWRDKRQSPSGVEDK